MVEGAIDSGLKSTRLTAVAREKIRKQIMNIGSIVKFIKTLEEERADLQDQIDDLVVYEQYYVEKVGELASDREQLELSIVGKEDHKKRLYKELETKSKDKAAIDIEVSDKTEDIRISSLIINFLCSAKGISDSELNRLVSMLIALRQKMVVLIVAFVL